MIHLAKPKDASTQSPYQPAPVRVTEAEPYTGVKVATLRDLYFKSRPRLRADGTMIPGNGFGEAFIKLGRALYVDVAKFHEKWRELNAQERRHG